MRKATRYDHGAVQRMNVGEKFRPARRASTAEPRRRGGGADHRAAPASPPPAPPRQCPPPSPRPRCSRRPAPPPGARPPARKCVSGVRLAPHHVVACHHHMREPGPAARPGASDAQRRAAELADGRDRAWARPARRSSPCNVAGAHGDATSRQHRKPAALGIAIVDQERCTAGKSGPIRRQQDRPPVAASTRPIRPAWIQASREPLNAQRPPRRLP